MVKLRNLIHLAITILYIGFELYTTISFPNGIASSHGFNFILVMFCYLPFIISLILFIKNKKQGDYKINLIYFLINTVIFLIFLWYAGFIIHLLSIPS